MTIQTYSPDNPPSLSLCNKIADVIQDAFHERTESGINFSCANITGTEYLKELGNSYVIVALDDKNDIVGTVKLEIKKKNRFLYGHHTLLAVSSLSKRKGVGSALFSELLSVSKQQELCFITSNTAESAYSSIKWHIKNGFVKYRLTSSSITNYYSINFILPLKALAFLRCALINKSIYWLSTLQCKISKRSDGTKRF